MKGTPETQAEKHRAEVSEEAQTYRVMGERPELRIRRQPARRIGKKRYKAGRLYRFSQEQQFAEMVEKAHLEARPRPPRSAAQGQLLPPPCRLLVGDLLISRQVKIANKQLTLVFAICYNY